MTKTIRLHRWKGVTEWRECQSDMDVLFCQANDYEHITASVPEEKREYFAYWEYGSKTFKSGHGGKHDSDFPGGLMSESSARLLAEKLNAVVAGFKENA